MSAATTDTSGNQEPPRAQIGEWFWRFLAVVMLVVVGWVVWIAIQINPPDMVLPAAYEAAAQGRARNSSGTIGGAPPAQVQTQAPVQGPIDPNPAGAPAIGAATPVAPPAPAPAASPAEPPVNLEKLRLADSIETPIQERPRRPARAAPDASK